jgi:hypothetical protein
LSRSKHTRPRQVIAASRLREPYEARGVDDPAARNRTGAQLKKAGAVAMASEQQAATSAPGAFPRISRQRPRRGYFHPASRPDVTRVLEAAGGEYSYGLKSIRMVQGGAGAVPGQLSFGRLVVPGSILIFEQPVSPWTLPGTLSGSDLARLSASGAIVTPINGETTTLIQWPNNTLRDFILFDVLLHELAHHALQQYTGKRGARIARTKDHEAFAEQTVERLRRLVSTSA